MSDRVALGEIRGQGIVNKRTQLGECRAEVQRNGAEARVDLALNPVPDHARQFAAAILAAEHVGVGHAKRHLIAAWHHPNIFKGFNESVPGDWQAAAPTQQQSYPRFNTAGDTQLARLGAFYPGLRKRQRVAGLGIVKQFGFRVRSREQLCRKRLFHDGQVQLERQFDVCGCG